MNKVFEYTLLQISNSTEILKSIGAAQFVNPMEIGEEIDRQFVSWKNHKGGRDVSSKAFTRVGQYLAIISTNAYQILLHDYSIIRYSFVFNENKLISQNLLWWPCPVIVDSEIEDELGLFDTINLLLEDKNTISKLRMRSPVRVDFDSSNDTELHPRAHVHIQHHDCRLNTDKPICFNCFIEFIFKNFYPDYYIDFSRWNHLTYQYENIHRRIKYAINSSLRI